jgi:hypothetical protein
MKTATKGSIDGPAISTTPTPGLNPGPSVIEGKVQPHGVRPGGELTVKPLAHVCSLPLVVVECQDSCRR